MKKYTCTFLFILLAVCFQSASGQRSLNDSLCKLLKQNIPDTLRVRYLLYFADRSDTNNRVGARLLLDSAASVAQRSQNKNWQLHVMVSQGLMHQDLGQ
ncbi:MAG: hypothetical protein ABI855_07880, partial [Bacteroidota bacterium]